MLKVKGSGGGDESDGGGMYKVKIEQGRCGC